MLLPKLLNLVLIFVPCLMFFDLSFVIQPKVWEQIFTPSLWALWGDKPEGLLPENCPNFLAG
jgi:hypothetical protein